MQALEALPEDSTAQIAAKAEVYGAYLRQAKSGTLAQAAHLLLGAYLLPKRADTADSIPTTATLYLTLQGVPLPADQRGALAAAQAACDEARVLHWPLAFPQVFAQGGDPGAAAFDATPMPDAIIEVFEGNVALGGLCNSCLFLRTEGLQVLQYGGTDYVGYQLYFEVSEQAAASPAIGDPPP